MILEVDCNSDPATLVCFEFRTRKYVLPYFKKICKVKELLGESAKRSNFKTEVKKKEIDYITGLGHGSYKIFTGQNGSILWNSDEEILDNEVSNKIIHLLSCQVGKTLGVKLVNLGAKAFFGYGENFRFYRDESHTGDVINDQLVDPFIKADSEIDIALMEGCSAAEVHKRVVNLYNNLIDEWMTRDSEVASRLNWDLNCFCSPFVDSKWGDKDAVIDWIHLLLMQIAIQ